MKIIALMIGGILGIAVLAVLWALRLLGWACAFMCACLLLLALVSAGHTHTMWTLLDYAGLCFAVAVMTRLISGFGMGNANRA